MKKSLFALLLGLTLACSGCALPFGGDSSTLDGNTSTNSSDLGNSESDGSNLDYLEDEEHTDKDNNDVCDDCGASVAVTFDLFAVNDLHGKVDDGDSHPGVDEMTTYLKNAKKNNENTIIFSSGDMWQGSSESNLTKGKIVTEWMNELDFVSMTMGNHEYDWGEADIVENEKLAEFPFLAINVYDTETNARVDYCQPSVMVEQNGVKIGIIGAIGDCYSSISSDKVEDVYFKTGSDLTALVKAESEKLKKEGADCIIFSMHEGYGKSSSAAVISDTNVGTYYDLELSKGYVDIVFEAHSHQRYAFKDSKGVYHLQGGGDNKGITHAALKINIANDKATALKGEVLLSATYQNLADDPVVDSLMAKYDSIISVATKKLGYNEKKRSSDEICQKVADLYYEAGMERWGDEYDIVLGGGFLNTRSPYDLAAGTVNYGALLDVLPFDNPLVLCSISGKYLRWKFFETDNTDYYLSYGTYGASVKQNIDDNATYYVVVDRYTSQYSSNRLTEVQVYDETTYARDLLADFIEGGGWGVEIKNPTLTSIPEVLNIGGKLAENATTASVYYVKGTIVDIKSAVYGNMTIEDEDGNRLYIYGTSDATGTGYADMTNQPQKGDTVVVYGAIKRYVYNTTDMVEMVDGVFFSVE